jgi:signal transduction histidine kinase
MNVEEPKAKSLKALVELSGMINSSLDIQSVLGHAMTCIQEFLNAEASSIFELDSRTGELFFRLALGDAGDRIKEVRLKSGQGVAGWVAKTGQPLIICDTDRDGRFDQGVDHDSGFKTRSILCVPMVYRGRLMGVLEVLNKRGGLDFNEEDRELLTVLANQIATAIENARLYERLNERFALTSSELRSTQEKLLQAERLAALGRLSRGVAHEVRNPVMVIGGFARRLKRELESSESARKTLDIILAETERLQRMVVDIEGFCGLPSPSPGRVGIGALLEKILEDMEDELGRAGISVKVFCDDGAPEIWADEKLLQVAFENVLKNSSEAMPRGGVIEIAVAPRPDGLSVSIRDTGAGISPEDLPNVFEPFFTSKTRGSGLGLTTVHRIVCDHGGDVCVESVTGKGTEVRIHLPAGFPP